jgi:hypothetical protein
MLMIQNISGGGGAAPILIALFLQQTPQQDGFPQHSISALRSPLQQPEQPSTSSFALDPPS